MSGSSGNIQQSMSRLSMNTDHGSVGYNENKPARYSHDYDDYQSHGDQSNYTHQNESYRRIPDDTNGSSSTFLDDPESEQRRLSGTAMTATDIQAGDSKFAEMTTKIIDGIGNCSGDDCRIMKR